MWQNGAMTTFVVRMPAEDLHRIYMFDPGAVQRLPSPHLVSFHPDRAIMVVRATFRTVSKMARMFPDWRFQALLG